MGKKLLVASLLAAALVLALVFGLSEKPIYSVGVSEFLKRGMADQTVRVRGRLVHGTLCKVTAECGYRFTLDDATAQQLSVADEECIVPDTFREMPGLDVYVTVEGERCQGCHDFKATRVYVKGSGKYEYNSPWSGPAAPLPLCKSVPRM